MDKPWYLSKSFWGSAVVVMATALSMVGYQVDLMGMDEEVLALIGAAVAIWGRFVAKGGLTLV